MTYQPPPNLPGHYWATDVENSARFNLLVEIYGDAPFLNIRAIYRTGGALKALVPSDIKQWGPQIEVPVPKWA